MASHRRPPRTAREEQSRTRSLGRLAALIASVGALIAALTGCAPAIGQVHLPARMVATKVVAISPPAVMTTRQQVLATFVGYMSALAEADESRSIATARQLLRPYLAASRIDSLVLAMAAIWARGQSFHGADDVHVSSVTVAGRHAFVHDCDNTTAMALISIATGQIVPGSSGAPRVNLITRLELVSGHWLVQFQLVEDVPCVP